MFIDSHTHLNISPLREARQKHLEDFIQIWGNWISIIATNFEDNQKAVEIATQARNIYPNLHIWATMGIHPSETESLASTPELLQSTQEKLEDILSEFKEFIIWIGEIGTDMHREEYRPFSSSQKLLFKAQCELAVKYNLPIIIHSRTDFAGTFEVLQSLEVLPRNVYFHCWGYQPSELEILKDWLDNKSTTTQLFIGFCGNISYPKAQELRDSYQYCLDHDIKTLIETDAPFLAPQAIRGQINSPTNIVHTYAYISEYFSIPLKKLQESIYNNFMELYFPHS